MERKAREKAGVVEGQRAVERKRTRWMDGVYDTERERNREVEMEQWEER